MLVGGRVRQRKGLQLSLVEVASLALHHKRYRFGTLDIVIDRNDAGLDDVRMTLQHLLDLAGKDVLAAADEHVVGPSDEKVEAIFIAPKYVAGNIKSVRGDGRSDVGAVVIAVH